MNPSPTVTGLPRLRIAALAAALCIAGLAHAQPQPLAVDLPAQPLAQSLNALARQSGAQIIFLTDVAQGCLLYTSDAADE